MLLVTHPDSIVVKLYTKKCKFTDDVLDKIVVSLMNSFTNKDYKTYNNLQQPPTTMLINYIK